MDAQRVRREAETPAQAGADDLPEVIATLTEAFAVDPHFNWFLRDDRRDAGRRGLFKLLIGQMNLADGRIDRPASGGAAAVWMDSEKLGPTSLADELRALPTLLAATGLARLGRMTALRADMDRHHPMERPHAYLWFLGVAPVLQGMGIGSRLLQAAAGRLDALGRPAYLETGTDRNVALYRRHGFEVLSEHKAREDAPNMWSMWREPR